MPSLDTRGRVAIEPAWPNGGMVTRPMGERRFDVQQFTGAPVSTVTAGRWNRGVLYRFYQPNLRTAKRDLFMYDPTDPATWNDARS